MSLSVTTMVHLGITTYRALTPAAQLGLWPAGWLQWPDRGHGYSYTNDR